MNSHDLLIPTHPLFKVSANRVFWYDQVQKLNTHGSLQTRYMAIATPGVFLFDKKTFPKSLVLSRVIPFSELILLRVDATSVQFFAPKVTMIIQHPKHVEIAAIVFSIKQALFEEKPRPPKFDIDQSIIGLFESSAFVFESKNLIGDRFLSLCLSIPSTSIVPDQVNDILEQCQQSDHSAHFNPEILSSPLIVPYATAVAYDKEINTIRLRKVSFVSFYQCFVTMLQHNSSIQKVDFQNVSFVGTPIFSNCDKKILFAANEFRFEDCELSSPDFLNFLEFFSQYSNPVVILQFIRCGFSEITLNSVFQNVLTSQCFLSLADLSFSEVKLSNQFELNLMRLFGSSFMLEQKHLKLLTARSCGLHIDTLFQHVFTFDNCLKVLCLSGNTINNSSDLITLKDFQQVEELDLSDCYFIGSSLVTILQSIACAKNSPSRLVLDCLKVDEAGWFELYSGIGSLVIPHLNTISWKRNLMKANQVKAFGQFLANQVELIDIRLSHSISSIDSDQSVQYLTSALEKLPIERLVLCGSNVGSTVINIIPILGVLSKTRTIKSLDISGQTLRSEGFSILTDMITSGSIEELRFEGSNPTSLDELMDFLERISNSNLKASSWPEQDIRALMLKVTLVARADYARRVDVLKKQFFSKLGEAVPDYDYDIQQRIRRESVRVAHPRASSSFSTPVPKESLSALSKKMDTDILSEREDELSVLLRECLGINQEEPIREPLVLILQSIEDEISIESFLSKNNAD